MPLDVCRASVTCIQRTPRTDTDTRHPPPLATAGLRRSRGVWEGIRLGLSRPRAPCNEVAPTPSWVIWNRPSERSRSPTMVFSRVVEAR